MSSYISIWTKDDASEVGPSVDEERLFSITVEPVGEPLLGREGDTGIHLVTDGGHGLWTIQLRLSPKAKAKLITDLGGQLPDVGELGLPYTVAGSVAQALGQAAVDRENVTREQVVAYMTSEAGPDPFRDDLLWEGLGPLVDVIEDESAKMALPCSTCGSTETIDIHDPRPDVDQSVTVCANCGADD